MKVRFNYREFKKELKNKPADEIVSWLAEQYHIDIDICEEFVDDMLELDDKMRKSDTEKFADIVCESNKPTREDLDFDEILIIYPPYYKKVNLQRIANSLQNYGIEGAIGVLCINSLRKEAEVFLKNFIESGEYERITGDNSFRTKVNVEQNINKNKDDFDEEQKTNVNANVNICPEENKGTFIKNLVSSLVTVVTGIVFLATIKVNYGIGVAGDNIPYGCGTGSMTYLFYTLLAGFSFYIRLYSVMKMSVSFIIYIFACMVVWFLLVILTPIAYWENVMIIGIAINCVHIAFLFNSKK